MSVSVVCVAAVIVVKTWPANSLLFGSKDSFKEKRGVEKNPGQIGGKQTKNLSFSHKALFEETVGTFIIF